MANKIPLKTAKVLYNVVEEAIVFHRAIKDGLADALIWDNVVPKKEGGTLCIETLLERGDYSDKEKEELRKNLGYWNENYEALRKDVFYRKDPIISRSER